jgi:hypothetical protein
VCASACLLNKEGHLSAFSGSCRIQKVVSQEWQVAWLTQGSFPLPTLIVIIPCSIPIGSPGCFSAHIPNPHLRAKMSSCCHASTLDGVSGSFAALQRWAPGELDKFYTPTMPQRHSHYFSLGHRAEVLDIQNASERDNLHSKS